MTLLIISSCLIVVNIKHNNQKIFLINYMESFFQSAVFMRVEKDFYIEKLV